MSNTFTWKTKFKSIIIVDGELFSNEYDCKIYISAHTADLKNRQNILKGLKIFFKLFSIIQLPHGRMKNFTTRYKKRLTIDLLSYQNHHMIK